MTTFSRSGESEQLPSTTLDQRLAEAARVLAAEPSVQETLDSAVSLAVSMVPGCTAAGVTLVDRRGGITTAAATDELVREGDRIQYELGEGPCLDAVREQEIVRSEDIAVDPRWPRWSAAVVERLGVRSMLCVQLYTTKGTHGALNLYALDARAFGGYAESLAATFGSVASAALSSAQTEEQLQAAVQSRTLIGQAQGMIMERYGLSDQSAFAVLSRISQDTNERLVEVARTIVTTRRLPGAVDPA